MSHAHHHQPKPAKTWGLILSFIVAIGGYELAGLDWSKTHGFSALTIAIVLGMIIGNTFYGQVAHQCAPGVDYAKRFLLRTGVVLFGLRLTLQNVMQVGLPGVLVDTIIILSTFMLATIIGTRVFKLDRKACMLIGVGSSICGAAAVMGAEPVVKGRAEHVTIAVATVVVFGTIAIFLYPVLYSMHIPFLPTDPRIFGVYEGSTIHEVAQVAAAASNLQDNGAAVIAKMVRVMLMAPFLIGLSAWLARDPAHHADQDGQTGGSHKIVIPWFAFGFIGMVILNSLIESQGMHAFWANNQALAGATHGTIGYINKFLDNIILAMAMGALGLTTHIKAIQQAGVKPILLALILFVWLIIGGAAINVGVYGLFN